MTALLVLAIGIAVTLIKRKPGAPWVWGSFFINTMAAGSIAFIAAVLLSGVLFL